MLTQVVQSIYMDGDREVHAITADGRKVYRAICRPALADRASTPKDRYEIQVARTDVAPLQWQNWGLEATLDAAIVTLIRLCENHNR